MDERRTDCDHADVPPEVEEPEIDWRALGNPWKLNKRRCEVLDAYVAGGCAKRAAGQLNMSETAIREHMGAIKRKMNVQTLIQALIQWDRYRRGDKDQRWGVVV